MCLTGTLGFVSHVFLQASIPQFDPIKRGFGGGFGTTQWSNFAIVALVAEVLSLVFMLVLASESGNLNIRHVLRRLLPQRGNGNGLDPDPDPDPDEGAVYGSSSPYPHSALIIGNIVLFSCGP
jgi:hypothetical protein